MQLGSSICPAGQMVHLSPSTDVDGPASTSSPGCQAQGTLFDGACTPATLHDDMPSSLIRHLSQACIKLTCPVSCKTSEPLLMSQSGLSQQPADCSSVLMHL